jgi:hypothetical protein
MRSGNAVGILSGQTVADDLVGIDEWPTLYPVDATPSEKRLRAASTRRKRLDNLLNEARAEERAAIVEAIEAGMRQVQVVTITGFTREYIRRIAKPDSGRSGTDQRAAGQ